MVRYILLWCISNREYQLLLINFVSLKERGGNLSPKWFMSDLAKQFYKAWVVTFENKPVCTWHIDRAWRENLRQFSTVYQILRTVLEEMIARI